MKVILQTNVAKLGKAGDVVESAPGYFRNFLEPRKLAIVATGGTMKKREEDLAAIRAKAEALHAEHCELKDKINALAAIKVTAKAGEGGRLYGKITNKEIASELSALLGSDIDKKIVKTADDISSLGTYKAQIKIAPEVLAEVTVEVHAE